MNDKEIFDLAETYGEWDDFGRWTFRDNDGLLRFVDSIVRTHTPEDIKKIERKWVAEPVAWREVVGKTTNYYDYNEEGRGEPLYAAPVHASDISQERVDETAKRKHEWVGLDDDIPGLGLVTEEFYNGMLCAEDILREKNA